MKSMITYIPSCLSLCRGRFVRRAAVLAVSALLAAPFARAAGTLAPVGGQPPLQIVSHHVDIAIEDGFARTTVTQVFANSQPQDLEAIYTFPAPRDATLADVTIQSGETVLRGEVVAKDKARDVYQKETAAGHDAGLAERDGYQDFRFHVYPVRAGAQTQVAFTYYQALHLDAGVGRYVYPLEEGGTDEVTPAFWTRDSNVQGDLSFSVDLKSSYPVGDVRVPGLDSSKVTQVDPGHWRLEYAVNGASLSRDFVFYYRLRDDLPGHVDLLPYKAAGDATGTFMLTITPGLDLAPLDAGADFVFVLDTSGSMRDKIATLAKGVQQAIGQLRPQDRFRIVTFNTSARDLTGWKAATPDNVKRALATLDGLRSDGSTNLGDGLLTGLSDLDADRVTSLILVTDGVANTGEVAPAWFHKLLQRYDLRLFGFLMGNSANYPLMETLCDATGGYYAAVSNADDIVGQIVLAKNKITHQALTDVSVELEGTDVKLSDLTGDSVGKVFRGQQLVLFGHYQGSGQATLRLKLRVSGENRTIEVPVKFPDVDTANPEIERLWALAATRDTEFARDLGLLDGPTATARISKLGVDYQIVTDETSMVVLDDAGHARNETGHANRDRTQAEAAAQAARAARPPRSATQAQGGQMGNSSSWGGGAIDPFSACIIGAGLLGGFLVHRRRR